MEKELYSVDEFCRKSGICKATFYNLVKEGSAPHIIKIGKRTLISKESFSEWIKKMESATANNNVRKAVA